MRIAFLVIFLLVAACAKKSKPATTPTRTENTATESPGTGTSPDKGTSEDTKEETKSTGDPCDGGESKSP